MLSLGVGALVSSSGYAPAAGLSPALQSSVRRSGVPILNLQQRVQSAAIGAALAASLSVGPVSAADPWPYSTLISKVQSDDVAKVLRPPPKATGRNAPHPDASHQSGAFHALKILMHPRHLSPRSPLLSLSRALAASLS